MPRRSLSQNLPLLGDVVALYIDRGGPYPSLVRDWYDETRDALTFVDTSRPVVAHPPCGPWSHLRQLYRGDTKHLALHAVEQVRACGGVLEHPAHSKLWEAAGLPKPGEPADAFGGRTIEVCQCDWGHVARKRTWLYLVGVGDVGTLPPPRQPTHWASGSRTAPRGPVPSGIKVCSAQQRRRTPIAFAEWLIGLARQSQRVRQ